MYASSASPLTPFDYIAAGYWQDFLADRPIAGGIAYESELRDCILDESLASLQRVDTLLSHIRREMVKTGRWHEERLLLDERYRNFMVFLAFYAGRVLAQQWQSTPHWYGQFELHKRYPELALTTDDFYQHLAVVYCQSADANSVTSLFFALEPIGMRLFGHIDRPFKAVQGGQVASGLYQAVSARLPHAHDNHVANAITSAINISTPDTSASVERIKTVDSQKPLEKERLSHTPHDVPESQNLSQQENQTKPVLSKSETVQPHTTSENTVLEQPLPLSVPSPQELPTPAIFTQLLVELDNIDVVQTAGNSEYQQAHKVLEQLEQHIAKQSQPRAQMRFSESHLTTKKQALLTLQEAAHAGNSAAMLHLAMYELLGEGLAVDKGAATASGVEWVKQAASKNDSRAQRLLSKMYYQGVGVAQDIDTGKYWLEQAAKNGHAEAASVVGQWQQAQALITTQKQEQHSMKRYQLLFAAILVVAILILIIV
ncbi:Sel1 repeat-containing protein [Psychrobacter immobilis]|uniref:Sel1 repeat-containing protein n=1 Tax=Psychrobacter immobilis TaxID=498 RepID=A0A2V1ZWQ2_PSYIM|nr:tetratricopeptide repeat protein [Psychrobacter immobilis]PWK10109.1 Sel1 repeat-containing protein [Psychrobacter immobilis]